jgi:hypothetical protein
LLPAEILVALLPRYFVSVDSKELRISVSALESTVVGDSVRVDFK